jgi:hypothetical protein
MRSTASFSGSFAREVVDNLAITGAWPCSFISRPAICPIGLQGRAKGGGRSLTMTCRDVVRHEGWPFAHDRDLTAMPFARLLGVAVSSRAVRRWRVAVRS